MRRLKAADFNTHSSRRPLWLKTTDGIKKYSLDEKLFGVFTHKADYAKSMLLRGFDDEFYIPHSRYTTVKRSDIEELSELKILCSSDEAGVCIVSAKSGRQFFVMGHAEYDPLTLDAEYKRDISAGLKTALPQNYYKNNNPDNAPVVRWRSSGNLLFTNWLNYFVYQSTPYDINDIK